MRYKKIDSPRYPDWPKWIPSTNWTWNFHRYWRSPRDRGSDRCHWANHPASGKGWAENWSPHSRDWSDGGRKWGLHCHAARHSTSRLQNRSEVPWVDKPCHHPYGRVCGETVLREWQKSLNTRDNGTIHHVFAFWVWERGGLKWFFVSCGIFGAPSTYPGRQIVPDT